MSIMANLNIRGVDDETKDLLDRIAAAEGMTTTAYIRQVLDAAVQQERQREGMRASRKRLRAIHAQAGARKVSLDDVVQAVREARDDDGQDVVT